jgi:sialate O-acetylesterase
MLSLRIEMLQFALRHCCVVLFCSVLMSVGCVRADDLRLAGIFSDNGVLQRDTPVTVWGWAAPDEKVTVHFGTQTQESIASRADGYWHVTLDPMRANGKGAELKVSSSKASVRRRNIVVGDVWLVSGQSNMVIPMRALQTPLMQEKIRLAKNAMVRLFQLPSASSDTPLKNTFGIWRPAVSPIAVQSMPAIGYLFGEHLQVELSVPVGIVVAATPSTFIQNWIAPDVLRANPLNRRFLERYAAARARFSSESMRAGRDTRVEGVPDSPWNPSASYNAKIQPLVSFKFKGVLWYQGEGNVEDFDIYPSLLSDLITSWRESFKQPDLPFIVSELAPYLRPASSATDSARARFGEGLRKLAARQNKVWVITLVDAGDQSDIHPARKEIPANRFALMAREKVYRQRLDAEGLQYSGIEIKGDGVRVKFSTDDAHLAIRPTDSAGEIGDADHVLGFELAGKDRVFHPADALITGSDSVTVRSRWVAKPVAVRYAWRDYPECNLIASNSIPIAPFRTDDWPMSKR